MTEETVNKIVEEALLHLRVNGWYVVDRVIPEAQVQVIRESVEGTVASHGIFTGVEGVGTRKGLLAFNQSFAPYLADERVLGIAEALLGPMYEFLSQPHTSTIRGTPVDRGMQIGHSTSATPGTFRLPIPMSSCTSRLCG